MGEAGDVKVMVQLPAPELRVPEQLPPVLAVTLTVPVGVPLPVTLNEIVTAWFTVEGFGVFEVIVVVLPAFVAVVDWFFEAAAL